MFKQIISAFFIFTIITVIIYILVNKIICKLNLKDDVGDVTNFENYALCEIIYILFSSICLLLVAEINICLSKYIPAFFNDSGFFFACLLVLTGIVIRGSYKVFFIILNIITRTKDDTSYDLNPDEELWTWMIICLLYGIYFLINEEYTIGFTYLVIDISYFFWLDLRLETIHKKVLSLKGLRKSYVYVFTFVGLMAFNNYIFQSIFPMIFGIIGIMTGISISIFIANKRNRDMIQLKKDK